MRRSMGHLQVGPEPRPAGSRSAQELERDPTGTCEPTMPGVSAVEWLDSLSPWPHRFGLERMHTMLAELGSPQDAYPAVHVVGSNGKSTAAVTIEQLLLTEGLGVGTTISPHVASWSERIRVNGADADFEHAVALVRPVAERLEATQFETVTAAALAAFAEAGVDAAVVEAGLGGQARRDERRPFACRAAHERLARAHRRPRRYARADRTREARGRRGRRRRGAPRRRLRASVAGPRGTDRRRPKGSRGVRRP